MKLGAVLAHFSQSSTLEESFVQFITDLSEVAVQILLVSTSPVTAASAAALPANVQVFERSNVGFDFCSYRFGLEKLAQSCEFDRILFSNNSAFWGEGFNPKTTLQKSESHPAQIVGLVQNQQFAWHLQSYFLYFKRAAIETQWFREFWQTVHPLESKSEIIFQYEIGLSQSALNAGLVLGSLFPRHTQTKPFRLETFKLGTIGKLWRRVSKPFRPEPSNPLFSRTKEVYGELGFLKWEWIKKNQAAPNWISESDAQKIKLHLASLPDAKQTLDFDAKLPMTDGVPWHLEFLFENKETPESKSDLTAAPRAPKVPKLAVVCHLFYPELFDGIAKQLHKIPENFSLYLSVTNIHTALWARKRCKEILGIRPIIILCANRGRDVAPFFRILNTDLLNQHEIVCKIHSKKSAYSAKGSAWRDELLQELFGSSQNIISILQDFRQNPHLGLSGPSKAFTTHPEHWGSNQSHLKTLASKTIGSDELVPLRFFAGTMFWFRPQALADLGKSKFLSSDFETESGQMDGTLAHAFERYFVPYLEHNGWKVHLCGKSQGTVPDTSPQKPLVYAGEDELS